MDLTGTAGRRLLARLSGVERERRDRAASNDNRPVELARGGVALGERLGCDMGLQASVALRRAALGQDSAHQRDAGHPMADLE